MSNQQHGPCEKLESKRAEDMPAVTGLAMEGSAFVPTSQPFTREGQPVRRFLKDMIAVGVYRHPVHQWTLSVTPERMDRWVAAFQQMRKNGVDVEVVVDHRLDAEATRGYVVEMFRWDQKLYGVHELIGEEAVALAGRVKNVSVLIEKDFIDGKGNKYGEAITHSSIVQKPIVPAQEGFVPIAASKGGAQPLAVFVLDGKEARAGGNVAADTEGGSEEKQLDEHLLGELRTILGAGEELTEQNALSHLRGQIDQFQRDRRQLRKEVSELKAQVEALNGPPRLAQPAAGLDPELLDGLAEGAEDRIDALVERGRITPAVAAGLKELLVGSPGSRNAYALSRKVSGTEESIVRGVINVLEQNEPVQLGERTAGQYVALSRHTPGQSPPECSPETIREMIDMASGPKRSR